jgi:hypothetical protein
MSSNLGKTISRQSGNTLERRADPRKQNVKGGVRLTADKFAYCID